MIISLESWTKYKLGHYRKHERTKRLSLPNIRLLNSEHSKLRTRKRGPKTFSLSRERLPSRPLTQGPVVLISNFNNFQNL